MPLHRPDVRGGAALAALLAGTGAALAFAAHHVPTLDGHAWSNVALIVLVSALAGTLVGRAARTVPAPVVVAGSRALEVRPLEAGDVACIARLHVEALPHGFLARLGQRFLRAYDRTFAASPHAVALVAAVDGHPVGFLLGVLEPRRHAAWLRRHHRLRLTVLGAAGLGVRPRLAAHFLRTRVGRYLRAFGGRSATAPPPAGPPTAVLSHIAVEEGARGLGAGRLLVEAFTMQARATGAVEARLLTVAEDEGSTAFYRRLGWRLAGHRAADGVGPAMDELVLHLAGTESR